MWEWFDITPISHFEAIKTHNIASKLLGDGLYNILTFRYMLGYPNAVSVFQDVPFWPHKGAIAEAEDGSERISRPLKWESKYHAI